jgi:hypothetical protein
MMGGACRGHGGVRNKYKILVGKPERKILLGRPRLRWKSNIRIYLTEWWIGLIWLRLGTGMGSYAQDNETSVSIKAGNFLTNWASQQGLWPRS